MPQSLLRLFEKIPHRNIEQKRRDAGRPASPRPSRASGRLRPARHPRLVAVGCGLIIVLCVSLAAAYALNRPPWIPSAPTFDYGAIATSAFQTAVATELGAAETQDPTATPLPQPMATAAAPVAPTTLQLNAWVATIPEAACIPQDIPQTGTVVQVVDATTIKVLLDGDGRVFSVRYIGLAAPDGSTDRPSAERATDQNTALTYRKRAILVRDLTDADNYGTLLRYVMVAGKFVNYALVAGGYIRAAPAPPDSACDGTLAGAEQGARAADLGIWAGPGSVSTLPASP